VDIVGLQKLSTQRDLVRRRPIIHVRHRVSRAQIFLRLAMAIETPTHLEILCFPGERHFVYLAVARRAADPFAHVNAVIEVNVVRQIVDPRPLDRRARLPTRANGLQHRGVFPDLRMTGHAGLDGRHTSDGGLLYAGVAITTINPEPGDVMLMTERHRLIERRVYMRPKIGPRISENRSRESEQNQGHTDNHRARNGVRPFLEKLAHSDEGRVRPSPIESQPPIRQTCHSLKELEIRDKEHPALMKSSNIDANVVGRVS